MGVQENVDGVAVQYYDDKSTAKVPVDKTAVPGDYMYTTDDIYNAYVRNFRKYGGEDKMKCHWGRRYYEEAAAKQAEELGVSVDKIQLYDGASAQMYAVNEKGGRMSEGKQRMYDLTLNSTEIMKAKKMQCPCKPECVKRAKEAAKSTDEKSNSDDAKYTCSRCKDTGKLKGVDAWLNWFYKSDILNDFAKYTRNGTFCVVKCTGDYRTKKGSKASDTYKAMIEAFENIRRVSESGGSEENQWNLDFSKVKFEVLSQDLEGRWAISLQIEELSPYIIDAMIAQNKSQAVVMFYEMGSGSTQIEYIQFTLTDDVQAKMRAYHQVVGPTPFDILCNTIVQTIGKMEQGFQRLLGEKNY